MKFQRAVKRTKHPLIAEALYCSWREAPPASRLLRSDVEQVAPLLIRLGGAGLAWNALSQNADLCRAGGADDLRNAHHHFVLQAAAKADALLDIVNLLASSGIELLIFKGWAVAQSYAKPYLRPFGDFDLCPMPGSYKEAGAILATESDPSVQSEKYGLGHTFGHFHLPTNHGVTAVIDLHRDLHKFGLPSLAEVYDRSVRVEIGSRSIRIPCAEDHLRIVIMHFLRNGGWRPVWLCDICALLEAAQHDFDWDLCFGHDPRIANWFACAIELARRLLGAQIDHVPLRNRVNHVPAWIEKNVVAEWEPPLVGRYYSAAPPIGLSNLFAPKEIRMRWPNLLRIAMEYGASSRRRPSFAQFSAAGRLVLRLLRD